jgi:hypothetical protein
MFYFFTFLETFVRKIKTFFYFYFLGTFSQKYVYVQYLKSAPNSQFLIPNAIFKEKENIPNFEKLF